MGSVASSSERPLRPGDVVEVRPAVEILATLDGEGALDGMTANEAGGQRGVEELLQNLMAELDLNLALLGAHSVAELDRSWLTRV